MIKILHYQRELLELRELLRRLPNHASVSMTKLNIRSKATSLMSTFMIYQIISVFLIICVSTIDRSFMIHLLNVETYIQVVGDTTG